jgi:lipopolysaccharide/colanic/teichoic acid biosynthesis glycosyltransferase
VKPGLTCIWQVTGRSDIGFEDWMRLDVEYVRTRSLWLDLRILAQTIPAVITGRGAY